MILKTTTLREVILAVISYNIEELFRLHPWTFQLADLTEVTRKQQKRWREWLVNNQ